VHEAREGEDITKFIALRRQEPTTLEFKTSKLIFNSLVGSGVQLGPLGTAATDCLVVPAPGDYDNGEFGGMKISRENRSTRRKPAPASLCPPQIPGSNPGRRGGKPAANCLSYGAAIQNL
jgi:hypothetical protein